MPLATITDQVSTLASGVPVTLEVTAIAFVLGAIGGVPLVAGTRSRFLAARVVARFLTDLVRVVPPIVWLFVLFYGLTQLDVELTASIAAFAGLGLVSSPYMAEVYQSGLLAVPRGQIEAGHALGLRSLESFRYIIAPQAMRVVLPSATSWLIILLKDTAIVSIIGMHDITSVAHDAQQRNPSDGLNLFLAASALYLIISVPVAALTRWLDARAARNRLA